jgi:hypothetical protein
MVWRLAREDDPKSATVHSRVVIGDRIGLRTRVEA